MPRGTGGLRIGSVFGISIYLHPSWLIIFILIVYTLLSQFTHTVPGGTSAQYWALAIAGSLLFFASILFHELSHSVVAKHYKLPVSSITLFVFGGLAQISREPDKAGQEFLISFAGPVSSFFLAGVFFGLKVLLRSNLMLSELSDYLAKINALLAIFNLVPGFPLDGGRVLRAIAWGVTGNFAKATRIASNAGRLIAYAMIAFGAWDAFHGDWMGGIWTAFIGWFLLSAAQESYGQVAIRQALLGLRAADVMSLDLPSVPRDISLEDYGQEVLRTGRRCHLVVTQGQLNGLMTVHMLNKFPRDEWASNSVQAAMLPLARMSWAAPDEPVLKVLDRMRAEDVNQMPVLQKDPSPHVVGMVTRENILHVIQTRTELGGSLTHA